jgi:hypothetical protein
MKLPEQPEERCIACGKTDDLTGIQHGLMVEMICRTCFAAMVEAASGK